MLPILFFYLLTSQIQSRSLHDLFEASIQAECSSVPRLPNAEIEIIRPLGDGSFGSVHLVEYIVNETTSVTSALKKIPFHDVMGVERAVREICQMYKMRNAKHTVKLHHAGFRSEKNVPYAFILMDIYDGDLFDTVDSIFDFPKKVSQYAKSIFRTKFDPSSSRWTSWLRHVLYQLALSVKETHDNDMIHLDIKPENYLVRSSSRTTMDGIPVPNVALSDFGFASTLKNKQSITLTPIGTLLYMAPEIFKPYRKIIQEKWGNTATLLARYKWGYFFKGIMIGHINQARNKPVQVTFKSDIYSLGVTFLVLSIDESPYEDIQDYPYPINSVVPVYNFKGPQCDHIDTYLCELIEWMMSQKPEDRPSIEQVLAHRFFQGLNHKRNKRGHVVS